MLAAALVLVVIAWVLLWTAFKGDGEGGYNPLALFGRSLGGAVRDRS